MNLSDYQENEYKIIKLPLKKCDDPDGYIEIGLKGSVVPKDGKPLPRASIKEPVGIL